MFIKYFLENLTHGTELPPKYRSLVVEYWEDSNTCPLYESITPSHFGTP